MLMSQSMAMYGEESPMAASLHSIGQPLQNLQWHIWGEKREGMREREEGRERRKGERERKKNRRREGKEREREGGR